MFGSFAKVQPTYLYNYITDFHAGARRYKRISKVEDILLVQITNYKVWHFQVGLFMPWEVGCYVCYAIQLHRKSGMGKLLNG